MSCFLEEEAGEVKAMMIFSRDELLDDIESYAHVEGHVMDGDSGHVRHMVQDIREEGNVDLVTRELDLAMSKVRELLYPYTKNDVRRNVVDNRFKEVPVYGISLTVKGKFSQTTLDYLEKHIHDYLVCRALGMWLGMTNPSRGEYWAAKAIVAETEIRKGLHSRVGLVRRKLWPPV